MWVIRVFQKTFLFFVLFWSVHCISDKFGCLWHVCMKREGDENCLSFSRLLNQCCPCQEPFKYALWIMDTLSSHRWVIFTVKADQGRYPGFGRSL
uniref:Endomorphin-like peptide n=1 Tax=Homo sapiens TaxID=9606 RepID=A0A6F8PDW9_HUMAN|nr:endomorphin-like peptide precursor [Homo sapiens]